MTAEQNGTLSDEEHPRDQQAKSNNGSRRSESELDDTIKLGVQGLHKNDENDSDEDHKVNGDKRSDELYEGGSKRKSSKPAKKKKKKGTKSLSKNASKSHAAAKPSQKVADSTSTSTAL